MCKMTYCYCWGLWQKVRIQYVYTHSHDLAWHIEREIDTITVYHATVKVECPKFKFNSTGRGSELAAKEWQVVWYGMLWCYVREHVQLVVKQMYMRHKTKGDSGMWGRYIRMSAKPTNQTGWSAMNDHTQYIIHVSTEQNSKCAYIDSWHKTFHLHNIS